MLIAKDPRLAGRVAFTHPNFVAYTLVTRQGAVYNGLIAAESASGVTLRRAEGKEDHILRSQIDELVSTGKSLMPEGLEKDISPDQMADLIAYLWDHR